MEVRGSLFPAHPARATCPPLTSRQSYHPGGRAQALDLVNLQERSQPEPERSHGCVSCRGGALSAGSPPGTGLGPQLLPTLCASHCTTRQTEPTQDPRSCPDAEHVGLAVGQAPGWPSLWVCGGLASPPRPGEQSLCRLLLGKFRYFWKPHMKAGLEKLGRR